MVIKPFNLVDQCHLPEMVADKKSTDGDSHLSIAHRKVQFKDDKGGWCDLESCDEMIIS